MQMYEIDIDVHGEELVISPHRLKQLILSFLRKDLNEPELNEKYVSVTEVPN